MNLAVDPVTARWADALYGLAKRKGDLPAVASDVAQLSTSLAVPATRDSILAPTRDREERRRSAQSFASGLHPLVQNVVNLAFDKGREEVLLGLGQAFHALALEDNGQLEGVVQSARPLGPAEMLQISTAVGAELGKTVLLKNEIHPELVGGARVIAGNRMIDYSVQGRLEALRRKMMEAPLTPPSRA